MCDGMGRTIKASRLIEALEKDGWVLVRRRGSHRQYRHPCKKGTVTVNAEGNADIWGALLKSIERQSGLKF